MTQKKVSEELPGRIKQIRETLGKSQKDFASLLGVHFRSIQQYESGEHTPGGKFLQALSRIGYDPQWVLTGKGEMAAFMEVCLTAKEVTVAIGEVQARSAVKFSDRELRYFQTVAFQHKMTKEEISDMMEAFPREDIPPSGRILRVPLHCLSASAGQGTFCDADHVQEWLPITEEVVIWLGVPLEALCAVRVDGNSMEPTIRDRELIFVDRRITKAKADGIYVIRIDDALMVKRIQLLPRGALEVSSDNPAFKPFKLLPEDPPSDFAVLARLTAGFRRF